MSTTIAASSKGVFEPLEAASGRCEGVRSPPAGALTPEAIAAIVEQVCIRRLANSMSGLLDSPDALGRDSSDRLWPNPSVREAASGGQLCVALRSPPRLASGGSTRPTAAVRHRQSGGREPLTSRRSRGGNLAVRLLATSEVRQPPSEGWNQGRALIDKLRRGELQRCGASTRGVGQTVDNALVAKQPPTLERERWVVTVATDNGGGSRGPTCEASYGDFWCTA
jgi:hypothetical protein